MDSHSCLKSIRIQKFAQLPKMDANEFALRY